MTTNSSPGNEPSGTRQGATADSRRVAWVEPKPERVPPPTFAPAAVALGVTLLAFGVLTSPILSLVGGLLACVASVRWIKEMHDAAEG